FPDGPPLLRFGLEVEGTLPGSGAKSGRRAGPERIPGQPRQFVVWTHLPQPIGGSFGVVAEPLFTLTQCCLAPLALGQIEYECNPPVRAFLEQRAADQHGHAAAVLAEELLLEWLKSPA